MSSEQFAGIPVPISLASGYTAVDAFNRSCGNNPDLTPPDRVLINIANQCKRVAEEVEETYDAAIAGDLQEILDGGADILVTAYGLVAQIQALVGDVAGALNDVCHNNSLKYSESIEEARVWLEWYDSQYDPNELGQQYYIASSAHDGILWHCIKRISDNKIMKPPHHPKVDLTGRLYGKE